jgi:hypothetical protein
MHNWIGLTVAQVLALCGASYDSVTMVDEPPGKLRAVELDCREGGRTVRVVLELEYVPKLFSASRTWDQGLVASQKVIGVREPARGGY